MRPADAEPSAELTRTALGDTALTEARGLAIERAVLAATLAEGDVASEVFDFERDVCATAIAHGGLGVVEVDVAIEVEDRDGANRRLAAIDHKDAQEAVAGGRFGCVELRGARRVRLLVGARVGKGVVVGALYTRPSE